MMEVKLQELNQFLLRVAAYLAPMAIVVQMHFVSCVHCQDLCALPASMSPYKQDADSAPAPIHM